MMIIMKANLNVESLLVLPPGVSLDLDLDPGVVGVLCNLYYFLIYGIKILPRGMRRYVVWWSFHYVIIN